MSVFVFLVGINIYRSNYSKEKNTTFRETERERERRKGGGEWLTQTKEHLLS
jgi:hypothetical protein